MRPLGELLRRHPLPDLTGGKDDSGTVLVVGGPPTCPGAVLLAGLAALRLGAGRVQLVVDPVAAPSAAAARPEALVVGWEQRGAVPDAVAKLIEGADVLVIGPGHDHLATEMIVALTELATCPVVLDAGALPACDRLGGTADLVIAPNLAEARQLAGDPHDDPASLASELVARHRRPVAVRGRTTVVATVDDGWVFDEAPPGLGTPGSGDVLIGILGALLAAGVAIEGALGWAVELHAAAGRLLAEATPVGYLAGDLADQLPRALATALGPV